MAYKWTIEIEVDPVWVADGFDLTEERVIRMLAEELGRASHHEFGAKILSAPDPKDIRKEQGYADE